jgi:outer membrane receptor protein involved in Fe transport
MGLQRIDTAVTGFMRYHRGMANLYSQDRIGDRKAAHRGALQVGAAYAMAEAPFGERLRLTGGIRIESLSMDVRSRDTTDTSLCGSFGVTLWLPALSASIPIAKEMQLRAAYGKTYAAPIFREMAPFSTIDVATKEDETGNPELSVCTIDNFDLRWEWFAGRGEILAASCFYKRLRDPIFKVFIPGTLNNEMTWNNMPNPATALGLEIELKKRLLFISPALDNFVAGANAAFMHTETEVDSTKRPYITLYTTHPQYTRPLVEASPYVINLSLQYENEPLGLAAGVFFNQFGRRLVFLTDTHMPDAYEYPRPEIHTSVEKSLWRGAKLKFAAKNLANPKYLVGHSFNSSIYPRSSNYRGRSYSMAISYAYK